MNQCSSSQRVKETKQKKCTKEEPQGIFQENHTLGTKNKLRSTEKKETIRIWCITAKETKTKQYICVKVGAIECHSLSCLSVFHCWSHTVAILSFFALVWKMVSFSAFSDALLCLFVYFMMYICFLSPLLGLFLFCFILLCLLLSWFGCTVLWHDVCPFLRSQTKWATHKAMTWVICVFIDIFLMYSESCNRNFVAYCFPNDHSTSCFRSSISFHDHKKDPTQRQQILDFSYLSRCTRHIC